MEELLGGSGGTTDCQNVQFDFDLLLVNTTHVVRDIAEGAAHQVRNLSSTADSHHEVLNLFYDKADIDWIFMNLRGLVTTIWILIASVQIVTMQMGFAFFEVGTV